MKRNLAFALTLAAASSFAQTQPSYRAVTKSLDLVDGALVCRDYQTAEYVYGELNKARHFRKTLPPELVKHAELAGTAPIEPRPVDFGCVLVPAGTTVMVSPDLGIPQVRGQLSGGYPFEGVTLPYMISRMP